MIFLRKKDLAWLERLFLFDGVEPKERDDMIAAAATADFEKGAVIYAPREFRRSIGVVIRGTAQVWQVAKDRRLRMKTVATGQSFGAAALFGAADYVTEVTAKTACTVVFFSQEQIVAAMYRNPRIAENYIRFLSDRVRYLNRRMTAMAGGDAAQKLAIFLAGCAESEKINLAQLAEQLNIGRTSLYRALDALEADGQIKRCDGKVIWIGEKA